MSYGLKKIQVCHVFPKFAVSSIKYLYFMKFSLFNLGNVSSMDSTRERAKRSMAVPKDVRMGSTLDA